MNTKTPSRLLPRADIALALAAALTAFSFYTATLAPGLIAITDTPKFQFIGRILGSAHPPGYPLYVLVSHVFGYLPVGSLAYRINLMSAFFSAAACGLTFVAARLLGAGRIAALASALAFAFGSAVWFVSTIAEVYALNAFFVSAIVGSLLAWGRTGRRAWFYAAVALVGISLGNHTTVVFMIPATALCAWMAAPRFALRPRTIATSALIVAIALTQYLFIIVRNRQGVWGEAPAWNLAQLVGVVAGAEYYRDVMPNGFGGFLASIGPGIGRMFVAEMSWAGLAAAAIGIAALWWRARPALALLLVGALEYAAFAAAYTPKEFEVFLIPAFVMCWLLAAAGAQWVVDAFNRRAAPWAAALLGVVLLAAPAAQAARNFNDRDRSQARADMRFFDALFDKLPDNSAILHEDFLVDRMVYYKTLGEQAPRGRRLLALVDAGLEAVDRAWRDRLHVFAFSNAARMMRLLDGAEFSYTPFELSGGTLARYLGDLPRGAIVAIGVPARHVPVFAIDRRLPLEAIGFSRRLTPVDAAGGVAVIGARGGPSVDATPDPGGVHVRFETPAAAGAPARPPIAVRVDRDMATIEFGGREIVRTARGMAVAVWTRDGLAQVFAVPAEAPSTPTLPTPYAIYPLRGLRERHAIASDSVDLTGEASTGSFVYKTETGASRLVFYAGRTRPLAPSLLDCSARSWPTFDVREFAAPAGARPDLARALERDGLPFDERLRAAPHVYRVAVDTQWSSAAGVQIGLGGVPDVVFGRLIDGAPGRVHGVDVSTHLARVDERTLSLHMARDHHSQLVGAGWSDVQADAVGPYRETVSREAELLLPIAAAGPLRVGVQLIGLSGTPPGSVQLRVNGQALPDIASIGEWRRYWWDVPASAVTEGVNSLVLTVGPEPARIAVSDILVEGVP